MAGKVGCRHPLQRPLLRCRCPCPAPPPPGQTAPLEQGDPPRAADMRVVRHGGAQGL